MSHETADPDNTDEDLTWLHHVGEQMAAEAVSAQEVEHRLQEITGFAYQPPGVPHTAGRRPNQGSVSKTQPTDNSVASGAVHILSAPRALCPHVEWALAGVLGKRVSLDWTHQPAEPAMWRAELSWHGQSGTAARITSQLRGWQGLRFEVTEDPTDSADGERFSVTPTLGVYHAITDSDGGILIPEDQLRAAVQRARRGAGTLESAVEALLGTAWDDELEPFRPAEAETQAPRLYQAGG